jgi:pantoate--beta-alanine ligase
MIVAHSVAEMVQRRAGLDGTGKTISFVPTMGALHAGHLSLIKLARTLADVVVVSIFVNPLQFGPSEDYARYPRPLEADLDACHQEGVDLVFVPSVADLYPAGRQVTVNAGPMGNLYEGRSRPGHFEGVLTVVLKLFNIVRPQISVFGQKDAQQLACVRRMVIDLSLGIEILAAPTVRERDGLAGSSRNRYLTPSEHRAAQALPAALAAGAAEHTVPSALAAAGAIIAAAESDPIFELDYLALVNPATFAQVGDDFAGEALMIIAARVGATRLIDNAFVTCTPGVVELKVAAPIAISR